jgi:hypothetical protein
MTIEVGPSPVATVVGLVDDNVPETGLIFIGLIVFESVPST